MRQALIAFAGRPAGAPASRSPRPKSWTRPWPSNTRRWEDRAVFKDSLSVPVDQAGGGTSRFSTTCSTYFSRPAPAGRGRASERKRSGPGRLGRSDRDDRVLSTPTCPWWLNW